MMRRSKTILLIVAVIMSLVGIACLTVSFSLNGFDVLKWSMQDYTTQTYTVEDEFEDIKIHAVSADIRLEFSESEETKIVCRESEKMKYDISVEDGVISVFHRDLRKWYEKVDFVWDTMGENIVIYLPKNRYGDVNLTSVSGNISIPEGFYFSNLFLKTTSGDIKTFAVTDKKLSVNSVSGDVWVRPFSNLTKMDFVDIGTTSGDIAVSHVSPETLSLHTTSGEVKLSFLELGSATVKTVSGDIELQRLHASGTVELKTTSGDVDGTVLSSHRFEAQTTSGDIQVPLSAKGAPVFKIQTTSGDIEIEEYFE